MHGEGDPRSPGVGKGGRAPRLTRVAPGEVAGLSIRSHLYRQGE